MCNRSSKENKTKQQQQKEVIGTDEGVFKGEMAFGSHDC